MKTLIVYQSRKNATKKFAEEIAKRVHQVYGNVTVKSMEETTAGDIQQSDLLFLGGRTAGKFIFGQKPDQEWVEFAKRMPGANGKKTVLFTTYDISTGKVFQHMKDHVAPKGYHVAGSMKSTNGKLDYFATGVLKYALDYRTVPVEREINQLAEVS
jgi:flavodoxin